MALGVVAAAAISAVVMVPLLAAAEQTGHSSSKSTLQERKVGKYGEVLTNSAGYSLYVLSTEQKGKLHCTSSSCLGGWPPLLIGKNAMISAGPGVVGKVSHVARGSKWQVTYNGWPVYTFVGDSGPAGSKGEKIVAFGGTGTSHAQQQRPIPLPRRRQWPVAAQPPRLLPPPAGSPRPLPAATRPASPGTLSRHSHKHHSDVGDGRRRQSAVGSRQGR